MKSKIKMVRLAVILPIVVIVIVAAAYIFAYSIYGYTIAEDYTAALVYSFGRTGTNLPPYQRLDGKFRNAIPEELYKAETVDEYLSLFAKVNAVDCGSNFFQNLSVNSTDDIKQDFPLEVADGSGKKYFLYHHVDVASTLFFEPVIVGWTVNIVEIEQ